MKRSDLEWAFVRRYTLRPGLCAIIAAVSLAAAMWVHDGQYSRVSELTSNQAVMHQDYDALMEQKRLVNRYHRSYQRYQELGFIGRESRLDWVESLRLASTALALPPVNYSIEPQLSVIAPVNSPMTDDDVQIRVSQLQLEMGLVHELDLLRFFDELQKQAPGLIKVDHCELVLTGNGSGAAGEANLSANCAIQIYSVITTDVGNEEAG